MYKIEIFTKECSESCYTSDLTRSLTIAYNDNFQRVRCPKDWTKIVAWEIGERVDELGRINEYIDKELIDDKLSPCLVLNNLSIVD